MNRLRRDKCWMPSKDVNWLSEMSRIFKFYISWQIEGSSSVMRLFEMFRNSRVIGRCHIVCILLLAIDNFFKNASFFNSGTSCLKRFPERSKSVKFLNLAISVIVSNARFTNLNEMSKDGFLTSESDFIAVVFELKLLELSERLPFLVRIVRDCTFCSS